MVEDGQIASELDNLLTLCHPLIAVPIGFAFAKGSIQARELKIVRLYAEGGSLADVLSAPPPWWTPTVKAKAVVGIALALRFAHSFGLLHGSVKATNVLFDSDLRIHIADFSPIRFQSGDIGGFSGDDWSPRADVVAFAALFSEIVMGDTLSPDFPSFVSDIIELRLASASQRWRSFIDIVELLKQNGFQITAGVDSGEVAAFVSWVESAEALSGCSLRPDGSGESRTRSD
jgi:serine/threonine protein kinase